MDSQIIYSVLSGAGLGLFTVIIGWAKKQELEKFDLKGLFLRVPIGIVVGGIAGYRGISFDEAYKIAAGLGVIMILDNFAKLVWHRMKIEQKIKLKFKRKDEKDKKSNDENNDKEEEEKIDNPEEES